MDRFLIIFLFALQCFCSLAIPADASDQPRFVNSTDSRALPTLQLVVVLSRHGNRSPYYHFPTFPYPNNDTSVWPNGMHQLTKRGRFRMYKLGGAVRSLYDGFLGRIYHRETLRAYSTLIDRVLMSAQLFLAGLYPPSDFQLWNEKLPWQPIPVYPSIYDHSNDRMNCSKYVKVGEDSYKTYLELNREKLGKLYSKILPYTGPLMFQGAFPIWDALYAADIEGLPLPSWTKEFYPEPLETLTTADDEALILGNDDMIRLLQGELFREILSAMQSKGDGSALRLLYYSGHDHTLRGVHAVMGLKIGTVAPGSAILLELHRHPTIGSYVEVLYIDGGSEDLRPEPLNVPGCPHPCLLSTLKLITDKYCNITDYKAECQEP